MIAVDGLVCGVDYAKGSVAASRGRNARLIETGRVEIHQASVSQLPFVDEMFDLVTAVETQYYWPDLVNDMREVQRVLKPGALLLVIAEGYHGVRFDRLLRPLMRLLRFNQLSVDGQRQLFSAAGYTDVEIFEERNKGWICATGRKPRSSLV
jgi:ubiquinone/menaquinone biosynthesis C-methylase UbiE